jgi:hypothetical protein
VDDVYCAKFGDCVMDPSNPIDPTLANKRPFLVQYLTMDQILEDNMAARVYLGVHWRFDADSGTILGKACAKNVLANL